MCIQTQRRFADARKDAMQLETSVRELEKKMSEIEGISQGFFCWRGGGRGGVNGVCPVPSLNIVMHLHSCQ